MEKDRKTKLWICDDCEAEVEDPFIFTYVKKDGMPGALCEYCADDKGIICPLCRTARWENGSCACQKGCCVGTKCSFYISPFYPVGCAFLDIESNCRIPKYYLTQGAGVLKDEEGQI